MKRTIKLLFIFTAAVVTSWCATAQTIFFTDNFSNGSTTNSASVPGGTATASFTSYDIASTKATVGGTTIAPNLFHIALNANTTSGFLEAQALFTTNPVSLNQVGDYIEIAVVFTNTSGQLLVSDNATPNSAIWIGLFDSQGNAPLPGSLSSSGLNGTSGSPFATGNCANWQGYFAQVASNGVSRILTRPVQNGALTTSANQDLVGQGAGTGAFNNPNGTVLVTGATTPVMLASNAPSTMYLRITLSAPSTLTISNAIYDGAGTGGTILYSMIGTASGATYLSSIFDGLAIGGAHRTVSGGTGRNPIMDVSSIQINGQSSAAGIPEITGQPVQTTVASNGSCAIFITANGLNLTYQWHRNGTNLIDGGNISGANSSALIVSSAAAADALSGANGYYCTVTSPGGSTNSFTNSLVVVPVTNLLWTAASDTTWDVNSSANWLDTGGNTTVFTFGDPAIFTESASIRLVNLSGDYISPASVLVNCSGGQKYTFQGSGNLAGPASVLLAGTGQLDIKNANSYTGGTIISNSSDVLFLENYAGIGTGPVTFAKAGSTLEISLSGSASVGVAGDVVVNDDGTVVTHGTGAFAAVFFGGFSGVNGKTLTFTPADLTTTNRIRIYGADFTNNANIALNGPSVSQANYYGTALAAYNPSGIQVYNGVISGNGGFVQRANGTTIFNGQNTYAGGTTPTTGNIAFGADSTPTSGTVTSGPIGTGPLFVVPEIPNATGSGTVLAYGGAHTIANPIVYPSGTNNQTLIIGGTNDLTFSAATLNLNGLDGLGTASSRTFQANNTGLTTISGVISDGGAGWGLTKTGTGVLALSATETYTGPTLISAGTLAVNGALNAASAVTITNGGLLGGTGTVNGAVTIQARGGLAPGNSIGTLTINNNLTIQSGSTNYFEINQLAGTKDVAVVTGNVTYDGTLVVSNLDGTLAAGQTYQIFNVTGTKTGNFTNIIGGPLAAGLGFSFTNSTGILAIVQSVNPNPTNITVSVAGNTVNLSWPADHTGWKLQVQTNTLASGLSTNNSAWFDVPNSTNINSTNFTINPQNGSVFYRLVLP